ncbi:hypothetical protein LPU83_pLPU83d_0632 (plasmid) [Rhizobium favelukesii]|uniref:Uncharacterized protein n=1 Tax=Rhizobium favelukesii TaxID=348824 RepID=W6RTC3_9HYPH|nr:hypothetical protein LPU83_pLPU83d_0632 [Rhizobium favelukesii]
MFRQPVEPIDKAQHIRRECVGDGEGPGEPFSSCQDRLYVLKPDPEERVETVPCRRILAREGGEDLIMGLMRGNDPYSKCRSLA